MNSQGTAERYRYPTAEDARDRPEGPVSGWNLRCNRCGTFGATWVEGERPGWGSLALCPADADELGEEHARHDRALTELRAVNYEQPIAPALPYREVW